MNEDEAKRILSGKLVFGDAKQIEALKRLESGCKACDGTGEIECADCNGSGVLPCTECFTGRSN